MLKKGLITLTCILAAASIAFSGWAVHSSTITKKNSIPANAKAISSVPTTYSSTKAPKYVFLFIGDGMSYPQFQSASDYLGALYQDPDNEILAGNEYLSFMNFPVAASANTYDSTSFCPDSASTATSLSTGKKTHSGVINMDESKTISYETITEKLKEQKDYKIGIVSTVNLNHATPAAFYAHQASRGSYYDIAKEMITSDFDYFAGGGLLQPTGKEKDQADIYSLAQKEGYKVVKTQAEAEKLTAADGKSIIIGETLADSDALSYDNDRANDEWSLRDYVAKGIEVLDNDTGFFMMVEAGKIDWACHANDAGSSIADTLALNDAVIEAINFYNQHPDETLILVTGDHETGGMTIGYAGTNYDTYLANLTSQKISYAKFDSDYVAKYKANNTSFANVLKDIKTNFGLVSSSDPDTKNNALLTMTDYEYNKLKAAYDKTMSKSNTKLSQEEYVLYGSYEPLTVTITHILNNKSGIAFTSYSHTGLPVAVFAQGYGEELFAGYYDNTQIYDNLAGLLKVE